MHAEVNGNYLMINASLLAGGRYKIEQDGLVIDNVVEEDEGRLQKSMILGCNTE